MSAKRILIVDDDPVIRTLVGDYLGAYGFEIELLESGGSCLAALKNRIPDLLIVDLQMPDMTGIEVLKRIRENALTAPLKVILLSANNTTESLATQSGVKADYYLEKPFDMKVLLGLVKELSA